MLFLQRAGGSIHYNDWDSETCHVSGDKLTVLAVFLAVV